MLGSDPSCEDELASGDVICMEMDPAMIRAMYEAENLWGENLSKVVTCLQLVGESSHQYEYCIPPLPPPSLSLSPLSPTVALFWIYKLVNYSFVLYNE